VREAPAVAIGQPFYRGRIPQDAASQL
jgi:hypothetical protein